MQVCNATKWHAVLISRHQQPTFSQSNNIYGSLSDAKLSISVINRRDYYAIQNANRFFFGSANMPSPSSFSISFALSLWLYRAKCAPDTSSPWPTMSQLRHITHSTRAQLMLFWKCNFCCCCWCLALPRQNATRFAHWMLFWWMA